MQRFGTVIAMAGSIPDFFTKGDKKTAHKHLGELLSSAPTLEQQASGTFQVGLLAAPAHGLKLAAAAFTGDFPHLLLSWLPNTWSNQQEQQ